MSDQIRPSEISEVLLAQLKDIDNDPRFEEIGTVLQVSDGVVRIHGLKKAEAGEKKTTKKSETAEKKTAAKKTTTRKTVKKGEETDA